MPTKKRNPGKGRSSVVRAKAKAPPGLTKATPPKSSKPRVDRSAKPAADSAPALRVFCSYCRADENLRKELETHLKILQHRGIIASWHDGLIKAGQEWEEDISRNLEEADIILLLVSADFIASHYCWDIEMTRAMNRHRLGKARVIPVILRKVNYSHAPFAKLAALPKDGKPIKRWPDRDAAWCNVVEGIEAAAEELRKERH